LKIQLNTANVYLNYSHPTQKQIISKQQKQTLLVLNKTKFSFLRKIKLSNVLNVTFAFLFVTFKTCWFYNHRDIKSMLIVKS